MAPRWRDQSLTWGKRLILVVLILGGIVYGVLSIAQRSKEPIRLGLQDYLSEASGQRAEITDLVSVRLTPIVEFKLKGIYIRDKEDADKVLLKTEEMHVAQPMINAFFGIRNYLGFEVKGMEVASGFFLPKKLAIDYAGISDPPAAQKAPQFLMEGTYNGLPVMVTAEMMRKERGKKKPLYYFDDSFRVTGKLGLLEGDGVYVRGMFDVMLDDVKIMRDGDVGMFDVTQIRHDPAHALFEGTINDVPFTAELTPGLVKITPKSTESADIKTVERIVGDIRKDIGVENAPDVLKFEIVVPETENQE